MMRRRALLAASQTGGGGKIRNVIRARWGDNPIVGYWYPLMFVAEYPVSSTIYIGLPDGNETSIKSGGTDADAFGQKDMTTAIGLSFVTTGPYESQIEDDTYIYELVFE